MSNKTFYEMYSKTKKEKIKINTNSDLYQPLPKQKFDIIYMDPPWDYNGKMQYDKSGLEKFNSVKDKKVFVSAANFQYPTLKLKELEQLNIDSIAADNCLLFMWTTGPHMEIAIKLGRTWGFQYKTMAFVWEKMNHNPGHYTLSSTEFVLVFKKGKIPSERGARNMRQFIQEKRTKHSAKPQEVKERITKMFPGHAKIELFARGKTKGWKHWGIDL